LASSSKAALDSSLLTNRKPQFNFHLSATAALNLKAISLESIVKDLASLNFIYSSRRNRAFTSALLPSINRLTLPFAPAEPQHLKKYRSHFGARIFWASALDTRNLW
jgi:hypothetical protein